ncbi:unnamed protein product, partial [Rotaria sordida]
MSSQKVTVWVMVEGNEPEKANLNVTADIADLKEDRLGKAGREYRAYFKRKMQSSDTPVPTKTTCIEPLILKKLT